MVYNSQDFNIYISAIHLARKISYSQKRYLILNLKKDLFRFFNEAETSSFINDLKRQIHLPDSIKEIRETALERAYIQKEKMEKINAQIIHILSASYPQNLFEIEDPPLCLYTLGSFQERDINSISIVGSRNISSSGKRNAYKLAFQAAQCGLTITSGLAKGIDSIVHQAALDAKGRTIAVLGSGLNYIYPKENEKLYNDIENSGSLIVSEYFMDEKPLSYHFPQRNRIIAGLSIATIVAECRFKSGALYTVEHALNYGRDVYAFPGEANNPFYAGNHKIIRQGASLIENFDQLKEDLALIISLPSGKEKKIHLKTAEKAKPSDYYDEIEDDNLDKKIQESSLWDSKASLILSVLLKEKGKMTIDEIVAKTNLSINEVMHYTSSLLIDGDCKEEENFFQPQKDFILKKILGNINDQQKENS